MAPAGEKTSSPAGASVSLGGVHKPQKPLVKPKPDAAPVEDVPGSPSEGKPGAPGQYCVLSGLGNGIVGGTMGGLFGFVGGVIRGSGWGGRFTAGWKEAGSSAQTFATFGGLYSLALCYTKRFRGADDAYNHLIAGCATGLGVGYKGGPMAAAQSCIGIGSMSFLFDKFYPSSGVAGAAAMPGGGRLPRAPEWSLPASWVRWLQRHVPCGPACDRAISALGNSEDEPAAGEGAIVCARSAPCGRAGGR